MLIARISRDETHIDAIGGPSEIMTESVIVLSSIYQSLKAYDPPAGGPLPEDAAGHGAE